MLKYILLTSLVLSTAAFGQSNDFGTQTRQTPLSVKDLRERLQIDGDIVEMSADGGRLINQFGDFRTWKIGKGDKMLSNWNFQSSDGTVKMALKHEWTVDDNGVIRVHFEQFDSMTKKPDAKNAVIYGKKLRDDTVVIKDFAPVTWLALSDEHHRIVARFKLSLQTPRTLSNPTDMPITMENGVLTDNKNRVWADGLNADAIGGKYFALQTYMGTLAISYFPFDNAKPIGFAEGSQIDVKSGDLELKLHSSQPFVVGRERLQVYGWIDTNRKSGHSGSVHVNISSDSKDFVRDL